MEFVKHVSCRYLCRLHIKTVSIHIKTVVSWSPIMKLFFITLAAFLVSSSVAAPTFRQGNGLVARTLSRYVYSTFDRPLSNETAAVDRVHRIPLLMAPTRIT